jgi:hypothetical protein
MYKTLTAHDVAHELSSNKNNGFTYAGALALAEYLEQYEEDTGEKIELDTIALRCEYSEYKSAWDAMLRYQPEDMPTVEEPTSYETRNGGGMDLIELQKVQETLALEWLQEHTQVIEFDGGIIIQDF